MTDGTAETEQRERNSEGVGEEDEGDGDASIQLIWSAMNGSRRM